MIGVELGITSVLLFLQISMSVERTAGCVRSFARTSLVDTGVAVPPDLEEMDKLAMVREMKHLYTCSHNMLQTLDEI